jgi:hypothetical protein
MGSNTKANLAKYRYIFGAGGSILIAPLFAALPHGLNYYLFFLYALLPGWLTAALFGALLLAALETYKREHWIVSTLGGAIFGTLGSVVMGGGIASAAPFALAGAVAAFAFHSIVFWLLRPKPTAP